MTTLPPSQAGVHGRSAAPVEAQNPGIGPGLCSKTGAGKGARTLDLNLGKVALYQLSYSRLGSGPQRGGPDETAIF